MIRRTPGSTLTDPLVPYPSPFRSKPGTTLGDNPDIPPGGGIHGGLHRSELATVLTLGGELFRREAAVETPCAITDLAPTMLEVFGIEVPASMAGRPLRETFADGSRAVDWWQTPLRAEVGSYAQELADRKSTR